MSRCCIALPLLTLFFLSCKTTSNIQRPPADHAGDSAVALIDSMNARAFQFETLSGKVKVVMQQGEGTTEFSAAIRMKKDSAIWMSISPALGIEVARVLITTDSVRIIDRLNKEYVSRGFDFFTQFTGIATGFPEMQDLISGHPLFTEGHSFQSSSTDTSFQLTSSDTSLTNTILLNRSFNVFMQLLKTPQNGSLKIWQGQYDETYIPPFSLWRKVEAVTVQPVTFEFTFTKVRINEPLTFPFKL